MDTAAARVATTGPAEARAFIAMVLSQESEIWRQEVDGGEGASKSKTTTLCVGQLRSDVQWPFSRPAGASSRKMSSPDLDALLAAHAASLSLQGDGRVKDVLTGHILPGRADAVRAYVR